MIGHFLAHRKNYRGMVQMQLITSIAIGLVVAGLIAGFGASILTSVQGTTTGTAANSIANATVGISNLTAQFGNIGTIGAAVVIIGLLIGGFAIQAGRGR